MNNRRLVGLVKYNVCTAWDHVRQIVCMTESNLGEWKRKKRTDAKAQRELLDLIVKLLKERVEPPLIEGRRRLLDEESSWIGTSELCVTIPEGVDAKPFLDAANKVTQINSPGS